MKKKILIGLGIVAVLFLGFAGYQFATSRSHSPLETKTFNNDGLDISISYCRPYKKGRLIFGEAADHALLPNGKYWRLGANDATEISFSKNIMFGGKPVTAGKYRMYAVPGASSWQISLNSELGKFGFFEPDYKLDVAKVDVTPSPTSETEQLTITFDKAGTGAQMNIAWDKTMTSVPITLQ
jgi:hypothetical protein